MQRTPAILYKRYEILYSMAQPKYIPSSFFFFFWQEKEMFVIQMEEYSNRSEACPEENRAHGLPSLTERNIWSRRETRRVVQVFFFFFFFRFRTAPTQAKKPYPDVMYVTAT